MYKNIKYQGIKKTEYLVCLLLLFMSGNPIFRLDFAHYFNVLFAGISIIYLSTHQSQVIRHKKDLNNLFFFLGITICIFIAQYFVFKWNTFPGIVNYLCMILWGSITLIIIGPNFKYAYLKNITFISIFSLFFGILHLIDSNPFPMFDYGAGETILFYTRRYTETVRNCGAFWEPGAFGCYILFVPLFFINELNILWKQYKKECIILLIALLSTQSTTAYLSMGSFIILYVILKIKSRIKYIFIPLLVAISIYAFNNLTFLSEKISTQTERALAAEGEFDSSRLGTLLFDLHYINKHPIIGNGLNERTRYEDHLYLIQMWADRDIHMAGNGFSDTLARMGLIYCFFFVFFFKKNNMQLTVKEHILFFLLFIMLLQGEPLMNYPLALSLPFIKLIRYIPKDNNIKKLNKYNN